MKQKLYCRRAGIEALIGHAKQGGQLDRSRMKSDRTTLSAGYASVLGFNLRRLTRYARGEIELNSANDDSRSENNNEINEKEWVGT